MKRNEWAFGAPWVEPSPHWPCSAGSRSWPSSRAGSIERPATPDADAVAAPTLTDVTIRSERLGDRERVRSLHRSAFGEGHGETVATLADALRRDDPQVLSLVAEEAGEVLGHAMVSRALLDAPPRLVDVAVLSPLAVAPERQRRGFGAELVQRGLDDLDRRGVPLVFVEGDPGYYSRLGFLAAGGLGFRKPSLRIPDAAFQVVRLAAYEPWMTGTLVYPDTFWRHDCVGLREPAPGSERIG